MIDAVQVLNDLWPGAVGAAISLRFFPGNWIAKLSTFASGTAFAYYVGPFVAVKFDLTAAKSISFAVFGTGLVSMLLLSKAFEVWQLIVASDLAKVLTSWLPKRGQP